MLLRSHWRSGGLQPSRCTTLWAASSSRPRAPKPHWSLTEAPSSQGSIQQEAGRLQAWTPGELQLKYLQGHMGASVWRLGPLVLDPSTVWNVSYPPSNFHGHTHIGMHMCMHASTQA